MKKLLTLTAISLLTITGTAQAESHIGGQAHSNLINNAGEKIGMAHYTQGNKGVLIDIQVKDLPEGKHGMHFHEVGTCEDHDHFKMAKGHIMPTGKPHGYLHPEGPHEGNLPNLVVHKDGTAHVELYTELVSVNGHGDKAALLDENGSTLMIHINEDDHKTQPIGGSGARIACGVIEAIK